MVDGGSLKDNQQSREQEWMMEAVESAEAGKGEIKDVITKEVGHEKAKKRNKGIIWVVGAGVATAGVGGAVKVIRDSGWGEWLSEKLGEVNEKIAERIPKSVKTGIMTKEENEVLETNNLKNDYSVGGMEGPLNIPGLDEVVHVDNKVVVEMAARSGGPVWLFDTVGSDGKPAVSEEAFKDISGELNLDSASQEELRQMWGDYVIIPDKDKQNFDQNILLNFLQAHGANSQVIEFYKLAMELKAKDTTPENWQDRIDDLQEWEPAATPQSNIKESKEIAEPHENFYSVAEMALEKIDTGDFGEALGIIETAAHMDFSNPEFHTALALDIADLPDFKPQISSFSPLPLVLTGLLLLRISPRMGLLGLPKMVIVGISDQIEDVYYWFRLGQGSRVVRDLAVLGRKLMQKAANNRDLT